MAEDKFFNKGHLASFKQYLDSQGLPHRPGKGDYQALQVLLPGFGWQPIYLRNSCPEHCVVTHTALKTLVSCYLLESSPLKAAPQLAAPQGIMFIANEMLPENTVIAHPKLIEKLRTICQER